MVAALVKDSETNGDNCILAEVVSYNHSTSKYEVDDILKEQNQKGRHILNRRQVIPLPLMRADPETDPQALFAQGTLGVYSILIFSVDRFMHLMLLTILSLKFWVSFPKRPVSTRLW